MCLVINIKLTYNPTHLTAVLLILIDDSCMQSQYCPATILTLNCISPLLAIPDNLLYVVELLQLPEEVHVHVHSVDIKQPYQTFLKIN